MAVLEFKNINTFATCFNGLVIGLTGRALVYGATNSRNLAATSTIDSSIVLKPLREPSKGLTSRKSSKVVL